MLTPDPTSLSTVLGLAATAGVVHTLIGPDHYLPLVAVARERRWSAGRASVATLGFGLSHCLASIVLVFGLAVTAGALEVLATTAAWLVVGIGCCLVLMALRRRHRSAGPADTGRIVPVLLGLAFLIGPCEWLIPMATTTLGSMGAVAAVQVCIVYTLCTVGTMWVAVALGTFGWSRLLRRGSTLSGRLVGGAVGSVAAGVVCAGCGALMLVGY